MRSGWKPVKSRLTILVDNTVKKILKNIKEYGNLTSINGE
jgi:hypothetical protein